MKTYFEFPAELAIGQLKNLEKISPDLKTKYFTVLAVNRTGTDLFKIRSVNWNGLKETARWCENEESRDEHYFNNYDAQNAPSKINSKGRANHYKRGFTSYIPVGKLVDLMIEVHDNKVDADQTKDAFSRLESKLVRRPPDSTPTLEKVKQGQDVNTDALIEELMYRKNLNNMYLQSL